MNNEYGTAGVDDYRRKDAMAKAAAMGAATGGSTSGQLLQGSTNLPHTETLCEQAIREMEVVLDILRDTISSQDCLLARLFGEQPCDPKTASDYAGNGASGAIKERLLWLRSLALQARENQIKLSSQVA